MSLILIIMETKKETVMLNQSWWFQNLEYLNKLVQYDQY